MMREWMIYAIAGAGLLALMIAFPFCSDSTTSSRSSVDAEAERKAQEYLQRTVAKCGGSYYVKAERLDARKGELTQSETLFQLDSPTTTVQKRKESLTQADELNRIQWEGSIRVMAVAHRGYSRWGGWSSWSDDAPYNHSANPLLAGWVLDSSLTKQNDQWKIGSLDIGRPRVNKPECSEIPPG